MQQINQPGGMQSVVLPPQNNLNIMKPHMTCQLLGLGISHAIIGVLSIVFQSVAVAVCVNDERGYYCSGSYNGHGFWCGFIFLSAGILGIIAGVRKNRCQITAFGILSNISGAFALLLIVNTVLIAKYSSIYELSSSEKRTSRLELFTGMEATLAVMGFMEGFVAIWSSVVCCVSGAGCNDYPYNPQTTTIWSPYQQPFITNYQQQPAVAFNQFQQYPQVFNQQIPMYQMAPQANQQIPMYQMAPQSFNQQQHIAEAGSTNVA